MRVIACYCCSLGYKGWGLYGIALKIFEKIRDANPESFQAKEKIRDNPERNHMTDKPVFR